MYDGAERIRRRRDLGTGWADALDLERVLDDAGVAAVVGRLAALLDIGGGVGVTGNEGIARGEENVHDGEGVHAGVLDAPDGDFLGIGVATGLDVSEGFAGGVVGVGADLLRVSDVGIGGGAVGVVDTEGDSSSVVVVHYGNEFEAVDDGLPVGNVHRSCGADDLDDAARRGWACGFTGSEEVVLVVADWVWGWRWRRIDAVFNFLAELYEALDFLFHLILNLATTQAAIDLAGGSEHHRLLVANLVDFLDINNTIEVWVGNILNRDVIFMDALHVIVKHSIWISHQ